MIQQYKVLLIILTLFLLGCSSKAKNTYDSQVSTPISKFHVKIQDFAQYLNNSNIKPIRVATSNMTVQSHTAGKVLPAYISTVVQSTLLSFGDKIHLVTSCKKEDKECYYLVGSITAFDEGIKVNTQSLNFFLNLSLDGTKTKEKSKYKIKNSLSQMVGDFYVKQNGVLSKKVSSKIMIRSQDKGYRFGINLLGSTIGYSTYEHLEDGIEFSMRKLVEASMIDLIGKIVEVETYHTMPEIQAKKHPNKDAHLSNRDFCSDVNKIVLYPIALKNQSFDQFGMSYQSEINKLKCFQGLYTSSEQSQYKVRLNTVFGELTDRSQSYSNAKFIQRKINIDLGISRKNLLTKSVPNQRICDKPDNHDYCEFIENRVELEKVYR